MRKEILLNEGWVFTNKAGAETQVNLPHTWNAVDGQNGGNDYHRGICRYQKPFRLPEYNTKTQRIYLEFRGVNASADVELNGKPVTRHEGGYSTFRADVTDSLQAQNLLCVTVDNGINRRVYPQKADFTFYGGIYRDVLLLVVPKQHFDLDYYGGNGLKVTPTLQDGKGSVRVESFHNASYAAVRLQVLDANGQTVAEGSGQDVTLEIPGVCLWQGVRDPYLYTAVATLERDGERLDEVQTRFGVRSFSFDADKGFFLNGEPYPLRGVSRHQDWKGVGSAITKAHHRRDMELIREIGANTIRLAHYQHDQYFYDLCDEYGMVVWTEIPYISSHMPEGRENTLNQLRELVVQNYHHPCIVTWGISNEITISTRNRRDMMHNHHALNNLCHRLDKTRPTTLACYALCGVFNPTVHVTDIVAYNLYLGWYVPGLKLNDAFMKLFHRLFPKRCLGYSEYGAEGMPNLHSTTPRRGDHTEEYQALYHEYMLECFERHPFLWGTYVWNMFDFAADARDQGGEPGMNHKGLITFDRETKKDSFYLYKAYWSDAPFVHICGSRFVDRPLEVAMVKVYTNQPEVALYNNGSRVAVMTGSRVFTFLVKLDDENRLEAVAGDCRDTSLIRQVAQPNPRYRLGKTKTKSDNWV